MCNTLTLLCVCTDTYACAASAYAVMTKTALWATSAAGLQGQSGAFFRRRMRAGGERKRLHIATEVLANQGLLFADEPTSGASAAGCCARPAAPLPAVQLHVWIRQTRWWPEPSRALPQPAPVQAWTPFRRRTSWRRCGRWRGMGGRWCVPPPGAPP